MKTKTKKRKLKAVKSAAPEVRTVKAHEWTNSGDRVLILRRVPKDGVTGQKWGKNFVWPVGTGMELTCPDWNPEPVCGAGLHGWPWGMGLGEGCDYNLIDDRWIVLAAKPEDVSGEIRDDAGNPGEKCKCRAGLKLYDGPFAGAWAMIDSGRRALIDEMAKTLPNGATGYYSTAASSGDSSTAASSGDSSTAEQSGTSGIAAVIGSGRAKAGELGLIVITWWDDSAKRFHAATGEVGINGIKADTWYEVRSGKLEEVK